MMPRRRALLRGCLCCAAGAALAACAPPGPPIAAGSRPAAATDEGGLWGLMDREEARLQRSRFVMPEREVNELVRSLCDRLAPEHARDIRVYVVRSPFFNASMAPNGMMQVWSGLLIRVHNEAQLGAVIGHELAHYRQRHSLQRLRSVRDTADVLAFLGLGLSAAGLGAVADLASLIAVAALFSYTRDQEREADALGQEAMAKAGLAPIEAARVWGQLVAEQQAAGERARDVLTASHPTSAEREAALRAKAESFGDLGTADPVALRRGIAPVRAMLLADEVRLRQPKRSVAVFRQAEAAGLADAPLLAAWGEVVRLRDGPGDLAAAETLFTRALALHDAPPEAWRGLGLVHRRQGRGIEAEQAFRRYLALAPSAPDALLVRGYLPGGH
jgi:predicted Zn-dependent protease